jgi:hypothetical protein
VDEQGRQPATCYIGRGDDADRGRCVGCLATHMAQRQDGRFVDGIRAASSHVTSARWPESMACRLNFRTDARERLPETQGRRLGTAPY